MATQFEIASSSLYRLLIDWPPPTQTTVIAWLPLHDQDLPISWGEIRPYQALLASKLEDRASRLQELNNVVLSRLFLLANNPSSGLHYLRAAIRDLNEQGELMTIHAFIRTFYVGWHDADLYTRQVVSFELGHAVSYTSDTDRWEALMQEAYGLARELGDSTRMVGAARDLGMCYIHRNDHKRGTEYLQEALVHAQIAQDGMETAATLLSLASASWYKNDLQKAIQFNQQA